MCGITAIFHKKHQPVFPESLKSEKDILINMCTKISHRGTDETYIMNHNKINVGYNRLSITERKTETEYQTNHEQWSVYLNGEIYNYKELGFEGNEKAVLQQGFAKFGLEFVNRLNGMFFILAIHKSNSYVLRDRYGIKPAYYYETENEIIISSEIKAIIEHPKVKVKLNKNVADSWLTYNNTFNHETFFEGVKQFPKATISHLNTGFFHTYWEWNFKPVQMDYDSAKEKIKFLLYQSVKRQIPQEVKYGTCLSGGLDSNIINHFLGDTYTFSAGFKEGNDERSIAEISGKKHYQIVYDQVRFLPETIYHLEDLKVGASWSNYGLYELASKFVKVLFDGAGGDELFGGYTWRYDMSKNYLDIINRTGKQSIAPNLPATKDTLENRFKFDADHFLPAVLNVVDKLSMAHTIEVRLPFLDNDLVDFCLTLPNEFKENKKILRDAFKDLLPTEVINQPKRGFSSPDWFGGEGNQANKWANAALIEWKKQFTNQ